MSYLSERREQNRADRAAAAELARLNDDAKVQRHIALQAAQAEQDRADRAEQARQRQAAAEARAARRAVRLAAVRAWVATHMVDLLIYPLAIASAVMAIPAMADWGIGTYHHWTGGVLPVLSELGMWAFELAIMVSRRRHPDRPVWSLQLGVAVFAAYGAALNFAHGQSIGGIDAGMVMAAVSVAGVIAHQLVTAAPRRSRAARSGARLDRLTARKVDRVRRAALRQAVAEIDADGAVSLIVAPGRYTLTDRSIRRMRRHLVAAIVPGLPVDPTVDTDDLAVDLAAEVTAWLATATDDGTLTGSTGPRVDRPAPPTGPGPIGTLDPNPTESGADQQGSTPDRAAGKPGKARKLPRTNRTGRTLDQLRAELAAAVADASVEIDPASAESIRKTLRCSPARARQLRDENRSNGQEGAQR